MTLYEVRQVQDLEINISLEQADTFTHALALQTGGFSGSKEFKQGIDWYA